jgi:hypothetical protein
VVGSPEFAEKARRLGIDARAEIARWADVAKAANIKADD